MDPKSLLIIPASPAKGRHGNYCSYFSKLTLST